MQSHDGDGESATLMGIILRLHLHSPYNIHTTHTNLSMRTIPTTLVTELPTTSSQFECLYGVA